jgi:predicted transcriptional regulator
MATKSKRFELRIDPQLDLKLSEMAGKLDTDRADVIRRALDLFLYAKEQELNEKARLYMQKDNDSVKTQLVGI